VIWVDDWNHQPDPVVVEEPPSVSVFEQDLDGYGLYEEATDEGFDPGLDETLNSSSRSISRRAGLGRERSTRRDRHQP
jgi:hypothetical protein